MSCPGRVPRDVLAALRSYGKSYFPVIGLGEPVEIGYGRGSFIAKHNSYVDLSPFPEPLGLKPTSASLRALLASRDFIRWDLYTFNLAGGGTVRYCSGDRDITVNGVLYPCSGFVGPFFDRLSNKAKLHQKIGTQVDTLVFDVLPGNSSILGAPFVQACKEGQFDAASMSLQRVYISRSDAATRRTAVGPLLCFAGRVAEVDPSRNLVTFTVNSWMELLNQMWPRNIYQPGCLNNLGDTICGVDLTAGFTNTGVVGTGSTSFSFNTSITLPFNGWYDTGTLTMTSGELNGLARTVRFASSTVIEFVGPFPSAPAPGDTFSITAGCDKSFGTPVQVNVTLFNGNPNGTLATPIIGGAPGTLITGTGVQTGTFVLSLTGTSLVMTKNATVTGTELLTFQPTANGCAKFGNQSKYRGFKDVPTPITAL